MAMTELHIGAQVAAGGSSQVGAAGQIPADLESKLFDVIMMLEKALQQGPKNNAGANGAGAASTTRWKNGPYFGVSHAARGFPVLVHLKGLARVRLK